MWRAALVLVLASATHPVPHGAKSFGAPNQGHLVDGKRFQESHFTRHLTRHSKAAEFAMPGMLNLLNRSAKKIGERHKGSILTVGDMSLASGGPIAGHKSHQNGRDADVGFYVRSEKGKTLLLSRFVPFDASGKAIGEPDAFFDDEKNWELVAAVTTDPKVDIRNIFVAAWLKARLLAQAEKVHAPKAIIEHAASVMMQPPNAESHDDHFHIRIGCVASQKPECHDDSVAKGNANADASISAPTFE